MAHDSVDSGRCLTVVCSGLVEAEGEPAHALPLPELPAVAHVGRGVQLRHHPHTPQPPVLNNVSDHLRGVHLPATKIIVKNAKITR